jgi:hypothetical protein
MTRPTTPSDLAPQEPSPQGFYRDRLVGPDGTVHDRGWRSNLIVDRGRSLLAGFMRGDEAEGVRRLLVGRGEAGWDAAAPPAPPRSTQRLTDPAPFGIAVPAAGITYLDAAGNPTAEPTHRLRIVVTLGENEPPGEDPYPMREFGLFGRLGGAPYMINYVRHPVLAKAADATLERTIRLVF